MWRKPKKTIANPGTMNIIEPKRCLIFVRALPAWQFLNLPVVSKRRSQRSKMAAAICQASFGDNNLV